MTQIIQTQNVLSLHTETLPSDTGEVKATATATTPSDTVVFRQSFEIKPEPLPEKFTDIDDFIAELEKDDEVSSGLSESRKWLAGEFYEGSVSLAALRLKSGLSQAALAKKLNTSQPHVARMESGKTDPQYTTIRKLEAALGVDTMTIIRAIETARQQ